MTAGHCLSFGCHVTHSDIAPGFCIREVSGGGRQACWPWFLVVCFCLCLLTIICKLWWMVIVHFVIRRVVVALPHCWWTNIATSLTATWHLDFLWEKSVVGGSWACSPWVVVCPCVVICSSICCHSHSFMCSCCHRSSAVGCHIANGGMAPASHVRKKRGRGIMLLTWILWRVMTHVIITAGRCGTHATSLPLFIHWVSEVVLPGWSIIVLCFSKVGWEECGGYWLWSPKLHNNDEWQSSFIVWLPGRPQWCGTWIPH